MTQNISVREASWTWPIIDKIYPNAAALDPTDNILIGRFVLVEYSEKYFSEIERTNIETSIEAPSNPQEFEYWSNYHADNKIRNDRMIYQKRAISHEDGSYLITYIPICSLLASSTSSANCVWEDVF